MNTLAPADGLEQAPPLPAINDIKPGKNYPGCVVIDETVKGKNVQIKFLLQSYFIGMYAAIYEGGRLVCQSGDHNNRSFVTELRNDLRKAVARGAAVSILSLRPVKTKP